MGVQISTEAGNFSSHACTLYYPIKLTTLLDMVNRAILKMEKRISYPTPRWLPLIQRASVVIEALQASTSTLAIPPPPGHRSQEALLQNGSPTTALFVPVHPRRPVVQCRRPHCYTKHCSLGSPACAISGKNSPVRRSILHIFHARYVTSTI